MPKHLVEKKKRHIRHLGVSWRESGSQLEAELDLTSPRLAAVVRGFVNRGLVLDRCKEFVSIPRPVMKVRLRWLACAALTLLGTLVALAASSGSKPPATGSVNPCQFANGERPPKSSQILSTVRLGGLSVSTVSCEGGRYKLALDGAGLIIDARSY